MSYCLTSPDSSKKPNSGMMLLCHGLLKLAILLALTASAAHGAPWDNSQRLKKMAASYDVNNIETVEGVVEELYEITPHKSPNYGYHMIIKTDKEELNIHLGPGWYLKKLDNLIVKGDTVQVTGARSKEPMTHGNSTLRSIRAAEVKKNNVVVLKLRDKNGKPAWSGY